MKIAVGIADRRHRGHLRGPAGSACRPSSRCRCLGWTSRARRTAGSPCAGTTTTSRSGKPENADGGRPGPAGLGNDRSCPGCRPRGARAPARRKFSLSRAHSRCNVKCRQDPAWECNRHCASPGGSDATAGAPIDGDAGDSVLRRRRRGVLRCRGDCTGSALLDPQRLVHLPSDVRSDGRLVHRYRAARSRGSCAGRDAPVLRIIALRATARNASGNSIHAFHLEQLLVLPGARSWARSGS